MILTRQQIQDDKVIRDIFNCAKDVYGGGIVIPSDKHPCGWDWLDFSYIDDVFTETFCLSTVSNGAYGNYDYEYCTLRAILLSVGGKFLFEINTCIDWSE